MWVGCWCLDLLKTGRRVDESPSKMDWFSRMERYIQQLAGEIEPQRAEKWQDQGKVNIWMEFRIPMSVYTWYFGECLGVL